MNFFRIILFVAGTLGLLSCKKVKERGNSEKYFTLYFADIIVETLEGGQTTETWIKKDTCFNKVYGSDLVPLSPCYDGDGGIPLPLNIATTSSTFYFETKSKKDSLTIYYHNFWEGGGVEFELVYIIDSTKTSFKRFTTACILDITPQCVDNEAFRSGTIY